MPTSERQLTGRSARTNTGRTNRSTPRYIITARGSKLNPLKNRYSRPMISRSCPLRTVLLDHAANNIPPSKTYSELQELRRRTNMAHPSFDIDGDGDVSVDDYILAKACDSNGNGVLEESEQHLARRNIAKQFFESHQHDANLYGTAWTPEDPAKNAERLTDAMNFSQAFRRLKLRERRLHNSGSVEMRRVLTTANPDLTRFHYYVDKFDTTAWNDVGANPRSPQGGGALNQIPGSQANLFQQRLWGQRQVCEDKLQAHYDTIPSRNCKRISLITNMAIENGGD